MEKSISKFWIFLISNTQQDSLRNWGEIDEMVEKIVDPREMSKNVGAHLVQETNRGVYGPENYFGLGKLCWDTQSRILSILLAKWALFC